MNGFNRVLAIVVLIVILFAALLNLLGALFLPMVAAAQREQMISSFSNAVNAFALPSGQNQMVAAIVAGVVAALALILLAAELAPLFRQGSMIPVAKAQAGGTMMARDAVSRRLQFAIDRLDEVVEVKPQVQRQGDGVTIHLDVKTGPEIDVPMKDNEIKQVARNVIEEQMGLNLKKLSVKLDHAPPQKMG